MIKPDIIVCWPRSCDYPLWRQFIHDNRERFNEIIIVFTETHHGEDYRQFVREAMLRDYIHFVDIQPVRGDEDWRNVAIHAALMHSYNAEWIWFTEQDFIINEEVFWTTLDAAINTGAEVVATYDEKRMHPCNIFIKRETLNNKTHKNFGIVKDVSDHFSLIQKNLEENSAFVFKFPEHQYHHLNGLSHNFTLIESGQLPVWRKEEFDMYLQESLTVNVPIDPRWKALVDNYIRSSVRV